MDYKQEHSGYHKEIIAIISQQISVLGFPGGAAVKNPPANAGAQVRSLVQEDPTRCGATKPVRHNYRACALEPEPQILSPRATTTEARTPRARAPQQEKPPQ